MLPFDLTLTKARAGTSSHTISLKANDCRAEAVSLELLEGHGGMGQGWLG